MIKENLLEALHNMELMMQVLKLEKIDIYILGGSACVLGEYTTRGTRDIDFINLEYPAKYGQVFTLLRDYDMLDYQSTLLAPSYKERAVKLPEFEYINVYILSKEDIAISKIIRLAEKDKEDLEQLIPKCNKTVLRKIIDEILQRDDLDESKKIGFENNLEEFKEKYNV